MENDNSISTRSNQSYFSQVWNSYSADQKMHQEMDRKENKTNYWERALVFAPSIILTLGVNLYAEPTSYTDIFWNAFIVGGSSYITMKIVNAYNNNVLKTPKSDYSTLLKEFRTKNLSNELIHEQLQNIDNVKINDFAFDSTKIADIVSKHIIDRQIWNLFCNIGTVVKKPHEGMDELINYDPLAKQYGYDVNTLFWMPESLNDKPMTFNNFVALWKEQKVSNIKLDIRVKIPDEYGNKQISGHWMIVKKQMFEVGASNSIQEKEQNVKKQYHNYAAPDLFQIVVFKLMQHQLAINSTNPTKLCDGYTQTTMIIENQRVLVGLDLSNSTLYVRSPSGLLNNGIQPVRTFSSKTEE